MSCTPEQAARGEAHGHAKMTEEKVLEIRRKLRLRDFHRRRAAELSIPVLAFEYGVHEDTVRKIERRETWSHLR